MIIAILLINLIMNIIITIHTNSTVILITFAIKMVGASSCASRRTYVDSSNNGAGTVGPPINTTPNFQGPTCVCSIVAYHAGCVGSVITPLPERQ